MKGTPNKMSMALARRAERELEESKAAGIPLAKEVLESLMNTFVEVAKRFAPDPKSLIPPVPPDQEANEKAEEAYERATERFEKRLRQFERWAINARDTAARLAPYQSPTYRAIAISPMQDEIPAGQIEVIHTMEELKEQLIIRGVPPTQLAKVLTQQVIEHDKDQGEDE